MALTIPDGVLDIWGGGQLLAFSGLDGPTPYRHSLVARTAFSGTGLLVKLPGQAELRFCAETPRRTFLAGDAFDVVHPGGRTRGVFADACHLLIEGPCEVRDAGQGLRILTQGSRTLVAAARVCDERRLAADLDEATAQRLRWIVNVPKPDLPRGLRRQTFWKCLSVIKTNIYGPEGRLKHRYTTPDRWPHRGMWLWDSAFNAIGIRHLDPALARDAIEAVLDAQHDDGLVQISYFHQDRRTDMTQPPTLALASRLIYQTQPEKEWLARIYPRLAAYLQWDMAQRDTDGSGLLEWLIEPKVQCRCGESGWDNSPRFDIAKPLDAVDFNSFLARECEAMAEIAGLLGKDGDRAAWSAQHKRLCDLINRKLWNEPLGIYVDALAATGEQQPLLTAAGFLPLLCGAPSKAQAQRLAGHLRDPHTFATNLPVATIPPCHKEHYSKDMWRGPVWVNINWCIARGLDRYGLSDEARELRRRTLAAIEKYYGRYGAIFEFFDEEDKVAPPDLLRKTVNDPREWIHQVIYDYMWTATLYIDMCLAEQGR